MTEAIPVVDVFSGNSGSGGNGGMFGDNGGSWIFAFLIIAIIFGAGNWGGNRNGCGSGDGAGGGMSTILPFLASGINSPSGQGYATRADINDGFLFNNLQVGQGNILGAVTSGFAGVDQAVCNLGAQLQNCCCTTQRAVDGVNYNLATQGAAVQSAIQGVNYNLASQACDTRNTIQMSTRDIIDNQNAASRAILDALTAQRIETKDATIAAQSQEIFKLQLAASQANQNAVLDAKIDTTAAELLRRTGHDCPTAAYVVQPPTPVTFPQWCNSCC